MPPSSATDPSEDLSADTNKKGQRRERHWPSMFLDRTLFEAERAASLARGSLTVLVVDASVGPF